MKKLVLIAHNIRSIHNVGSLLRTSDGLGVEEVYLTGYTPYPLAKNDSRLPHLAKKIAKQIDKTALGAQNNVKWHHFENIQIVIGKLRYKGYQIVALEQTPTAISLADFQSADRVALIVGREVEGIEPEVLDEADAHVEIKMYGQKESFNVAVAAGIALYHLSLS